MKEKIGMEKLIELLNEYEIEKEKSELLYEIVKLIMYIEFGFFVGLFIQTYKIPF